MIVSADLRALNLSNKGQTPRIEKQPAEPAVAANSVSAAIPPIDLGLSNSNYGTTNTGIFGEPQVAGLLTVMI